MIAGIFGLIGYIVWDRRTALRPVEQRIMALVLLFAAPLLYLVPFFLVPLLFASRRYLREAGIPLEITYGADIQTDLELVQDLKRGNRSCMFSPRMHTTQYGGPRYSPSRLLGRLFIQKIIH